MATGRAEQNAVIGANFTPTCLGMEDSEDTLISKMCKWSWAPFKIFVGRASSDTFAWGGPES